MIRNFIAVIVGLFAGMVVNMALVMLNGYVLFPMPEGTDMNDTEQMNAYVAVRLFLEVGVDHQVLPTTLHSCSEVIPR